MQARPGRDINDLAQEVADFLFAGGTVGQIHGLDTEDLEAVYALGYNLYNQARWDEALRVFCFLSVEDHLDRRFHVARGGCLLMLRRYEEGVQSLWARSRARCVGPGGGVAVRRVFDRATPQG